MSRVIAGLALVIMLLAAIVPPAPPTSLTGQATYYARGRLDRPSLMRRVWTYRQRIGHVAPCPECVDGVALLDCKRLGQRVWVEHPSGEIVGPLLVVDCARKQDRAELTRRGWVVDLSWELGRVCWQMRAPLAGVRVHFVEPVAELKGQGHQGSFVVIY